MVDWNELFYHKDGKLFNKVARGGRAKKDAEAGCINEHGYRVMKVKNKNLRVHRVIWEMHHGEIPSGMEIDHINHNRLDNRLENLRLVTPQVNHQNQTKRVDNTSGVTGVWWDSWKTKWKTGVKIDGKYKYLGYFDDLEFAELVVTEAREKYGFHQNHGQ